MCGVTSKQRMSQRTGASLSFVLGNLQSQSTDACTKRRTDQHACHGASTLPTTDPEAGAAAPRVITFTEDDHEQEKRLHHLPPPLLQTSRRTMVFCISCCCCIATSLIIVATMTIIGYSDSPIAMLRAPPHSRNASIVDRARIGLWDSQRAITKLQLQVAVSLALGVRALDDDIHIVENDQHFFTVNIDHTDTDEIEFMRGHRFLALLNTNLAPFGGLCVVSNEVVRLTH